MNDVGDIVAVALSSFAAGIAVASAVLTYLSNRQAKR
jgi:hypothetical protein